MAPVGAPSAGDVQLFDTGQLLLAHLLRRAGEILPTLDETSTADRRIDGELYIAQAYWNICARHPWRFNRKSPPAQFVSIAKDAVTVSSIAGATVTLSANLTPTRAGRKVYLDGDGIPHRILSHTAGTATLTLATVYTGTGSSGAATIYQDEIEVASDILAFPRVTDLHSGGDVEIVNEAEFAERCGRNLRGIGRAKRYGTFLTTGALRIGPWTETAQLFECAYNYRPDPLTFDGVEATDTPVIPRHYRAAIAWEALALLLVDRRQLDKAETVRKDEVAPLLESMQRTALTFSKPRTFVQRGHSIGGRR